MFEQNSLPRTLILCDEPINRIGGGGVTMGSLFRGWPTDRLAQIWAHHRFEIDTDICPSFLRLGSHTMPGERWVPPFIRRQRKAVARIRSLVRPGLRLDYSPILEWATKFSPEIIYTQPTPYPMYTWSLPVRLADDLHVPLVTHIMDDWPQGIEPEWPPLYRAIMRKVLRRHLTHLFRRSSATLVISEQMASAYEGRYGGTFCVFHNAVDLDAWDAPKSDYEIGDDRFTLVYLGALAENMQVHSLREIALVVANLARAGVPVGLTVYTGDIYRSLFDHHLGGVQGVSHGGSVQRSDLCHTLAAADLLVIPVNFDERSLDMARFSMPTKVPEYMASGTPILVYAPPEVPPASYARAGQWGYVISESSSTRLREGIDTLMSSVDLRRRLGQRARRLALQNHNAAAVRHEFREVLKGAIATYHQGEQQ